MYVGVAVAIIAVTTIAVLVVLKSVRKPPRLES
jgi:hypothetical protein